MKFLKNRYMSPKKEEEEGGEDIIKNETGDVEGTGNDARLAKFNAIADKADEERKEELGEPDFGTHDVVDEDEEEPKEELKTDKERLEEEETPPSEEPVKKYKIKVNGKELELTEEELIARAQKVESADQYLRDAKNQRQPQPPQRRPSQEELQRLADEEDRALVRAIQMGTEEEATAAIRKLRQQASARPSISADDVSRTIDERLIFNDAIREFRREFKDIASDPFLNSLALQKDAEMLANGDQRAYSERYTEIGTEIRNWLKSKTGAPSQEEKPKMTIKDKEEKKASASKVPVPASRKNTPPPEEEEEDDSPSAVIARISKARGGPQWMRG